MSVLDGAAAGLRTSAYDAHRAGDAEQPAPANNPYPAPMNVIVARGDPFRGVGSAPQPNPDVQEQLAEAKAALAEARARASSEPVVLVVGMLDGGCVCGGGASLHKRCHHHARWIFPLASVATLAVFVASQVLNQGVVWLTIDAPKMPLLLPAGLHLQQAAMNATYWESIQDGWDAGAAVSTAMNAGATGLLPALVLLLLNVCWFFESPRVCGDRDLFSIVIGLAMQCSKTSSWFLMFSFIQALGFQYSLVFDFNDHNIDIKMDIAATSGAYAMTVAILMFQMCSNGIFIADRAMLHASRSDTTDSATHRPLLTSTWAQMAASRENGCDLRVVGSTLAAVLTQTIVAALIIGTPYLTWRALTVPCFQFEFETQIEWNIVLTDCGGKVCRGEKRALLPLVIAIWNGAMQGPGTDPTSYDLIGNKLFGMFFVLCMIVLPYAAQLIWAVVWVMPLRSRTQQWLSSLALVFQAWNCMDLFFVALSTLDHDLAPITAYSADTACQPLAQIIPKFVGELLHPGNHCLATTLVVRDQEGYWYLLAAISAQWLLLFAMCVLCHEGSRRETEQGRPGSAASSVKTALLYDGPSVAQGGVQRKPPT